MSIFDKDTITKNPVTAQTLRDVIDSRKGFVGETMEQICDKLLNVLYDEVKYSVKMPIYEHFTSPKALGGMSSVFREGVDVKKMSQNLEPIPLESLVPDFVKFVKFFRDRGFRVKIAWETYNIDPSPTSKYISIDWE